MKNLYVHREGIHIHDIFDKPFTLKGVGIGSWLYFEGYMFKSFGELDRHHRWVKHVEKLCGKTYCDHFFESFYQLFFTENDIALLKKEGFNSIRIPLDYQFLFKKSDVKVKLEIDEKHFKYLDDMIGLCHKHQIYVILDLHAAPGGQTGTNIDNSNDFPELFTNDLYVDQTVYIWRELANRYKNEQYIAAYDLLNEPLPHMFHEYEHLLMPLYEKIIKAIRTVDPYHMITLEGTHWSTKWDIFDHLPDDNIMLQFHKYWNEPTIESIKPFLDKRKEFQVPIYMGEGGENNLLWYSTVFKLYDQLNISYAFWTYKKMDNNNSIISFEKPLLWDLFIEGKLNQMDAIITLDTLLRNITFEHCKIHDDVINHIQRKNSFETYAFGYDFLGEEVSFHSTHEGKSLFRENDDFQITQTYEKEAIIDFKHYNGEVIPYKNRLKLFLEKDEWVTYSFEIMGDNHLDISIKGRCLYDLVIYLNDKEEKLIDETIHIKKPKHGKHQLKLVAKDLVELETIVFMKT